MEDIYTLLGLRGRELEGIDANILMSALTPPHVGSDNYDAYEFVGDSVLSLVVTNILYRMGVRSPDVMSKTRSLVTKNSTLACMVTSIGLDKRVFGCSKMTEKGKADIFEAIVGAVYMWSQGRVHDPLESITTWLVSHWNIAVLISNVLKGFNENHQNIPLLSFMKINDFVVLDINAARRQILREIDLANSIKPCLSTDLYDIQTQINENETLSIEELKKYKVRIYAIAMKS